MSTRTRPASEDTVLSRRALNRALLARQLLLTRQRRPVIEVIDHLVGMQAQVPRDPYTALWSRLEGFDPAELERLLLDREVARSPLLRGTIHLSTARDCLELRPLVQPVLDRAQKGAFGKRLAGADLKALARRGRALLTKQPLTFAQIREALGEEWGAYDPQGVGYSVSYLVPLVQAPPRGLWTRTGLPAWQTTEAYFNAPLAERPSPDEVVRRYLAAFGPASVNDVQAWCGLTKLRAVVERLRPELLTFRDEQGVELFDLPDAPRPDPKTPAPPRFLPQYDNVFLGHADRSRIMAAETPALVANPNGWVSMLLVDGFIDATWRLERERKAATLQITVGSPGTELEFAL